jgi:hypothetical protein
LRGFELKDVDGYVLFLVVLVDDGHSNRKPQNNKMQRTAWPGWSFAADPGVRAHRGRGEHERISRSDSRSASRPRYKGSWRSCLRAMWRLLKEHYAAPAHTIAATKLAEAVGYKNLLWCEPAVTGRLPVASGRRSSRVLEDLHRPKASGGVRQCPVKEAIPISSGSCALS